MNQGPSFSGPAAHAGSGAESSDDVPTEAIRSILHRILSSKTLANSPRYREFLQFTVTRLWPAAAKA
jgi:hypothetical protein